MRHPSLLALALVAVPALAAPPPLAFSSLNPLFVERFEDANITARGWYDNTTIPLSTVEHIPGSVSSVEYRFLPRATTPTGGGMRHKFAAADRVYLSYWVKYSANWEGSNKPYHPHEFHFTTNLNSDWVGPAFTHLTTYIEQNEGRPLIGFQDGENIDQGQIRVDLTQLTENRAVSGCNGDSDGWGLGDCYLSGTLWRNGKSWRAPQLYFQDTAGPYYKNDWHFIEAYFQLSSVAAGKGIADGRVAYWFDGQNVIDARRVMMRTGANPSMAFNQFLVLPYIGDGSPVDQTMWVDDLTVAVPGVSLLRNDEIASLPAARAALPGIFAGSGDVTLDERGGDANPQPGEGARESSNGSADDDDFYVAFFTAGSSDPDPRPIVTDAARPLVFWQVSEPGNVLRAAKSGTGRAALSW